MLLWWAVATARISKSSWIFRSLCSSYKSWPCCASHKSFSPVSIIYFFSSGLVKITGSENLKSRLLHFLQFWSIISIIFFSGKLSQTHGQAGQLGDLGAGRGTGEKGNQKICTLTALVGGQNLIITIPSQCSAASPFTPLQCHQHLLSHIFVPHCFLTPSHRMLLGTHPGGAAPLLCHLPGDVERHRDTMGLRVGTVGNCPC